MDRVMFYCPITEQRRIREVCEHFVALRKGKEQLPDGNFSCSAAINGRRCPVAVEMLPAKKKRRKRNVAK